MRLAETMLCFLRPFNISHSLQTAAAVFSLGRLHPPPQRHLGPDAERLEGAADTQQGALAHQRQLRFFSVNHGPALGPAHNPKLRDKNSRSTLSCPICW